MQVMDKASKAHAPKGEVVGAVEELSEVCTRSKHTRYAVQEVAIS
jgi:hypothetical protein